ncbi:MAG: (2Fe-2S)-binding protein [Acidimicrobiales bacterium]
MADERPIELTVNGRPVDDTVETRVHLADFLRQQLGLTGTHLGCEHGVCGACTVIVDGEATRSCLMLAVQANGTEVTTIEGLADGDELHPVQRAFQDNHGLQCGFCTSGMVMSLAAFIDESPDPDERQVREAISGNTCRCTGYQGIVAAGLQAAAALRSAADLDGEGRR